MMVEPITLQKGRSGTWGVTRVELMQLPRKVLWGRWQPDTRMVMLFRCTGMKALSTQSLLVCPWQQPLQACPELLKSLGFYFFLRLQCESWLVSVGRAYSHA